MYTRFLSHPSFRTVHSTQSRSLALHQARHIRRGGPGVVRRRAPPVFIVGASDRDVVVAHVVEREDVEVVRSGEDAVLLVHDRSLQVNALPRPSSPAPVEHHEQGRAPAIAGDRRGDGEPVAEAEASAPCRVRIVRIPRNSAAPHLLGLFNDGREPEWLLLPLLLRARGVARRVWKPGGVGGKSGKRCHHGDDPPLVQPAHLSSPSHLPSSS